MFYRDHRKPMFDEAGKIQRELISKMYKFSFFIFPCLPIYLIIQKRKTGLSKTRLRLKTGCGFIQLFEFDDAPSPPPQKISPIHLRCRSQELFSTQYEHRPRPTAKSADKLLLFPRHIQTQDYRNPCRV